MKAIYKYQLSLQGVDIRTLPADFEVLSVQIQHNIITMWAYVDDTSNACEVEIKIIGTGTEFKNRRKYSYIGTVQLDSFVWHIFIKRLT
jgi:hypothetical protein